MATRTQARECVISLAYAKDINNNIDEYIEEFLEEKKIRNKQKNFALLLLNGTFENLENIDEKINSFLKDWKVANIGNIERAILRVSTYELLYTKTQSAIIINEAIEISKKLCQENSAKFINGVLDAINKELS